MNAFKILPVVAIFALSPALQAADTFVSHYEPLHGTTVRAAEYVTTDAKQQRAAPVALGFAFGWVPFLAVFGVTLLEILVALIQAYVFALLTSLYLNDAINLH